MERGKAKTVKKYKVLFLPVSKEITVKEDRTILDIAREAGVYINSQCNGKGSCGKCRVQIMEGKANPFTHEESDFIRNLEKEFGWRARPVFKVMPRFWFPEKMCSPPKRQKRSSQKARL
jgi:ferredoxin